MEHEKPIERAKIVVAKRTRDKSQRSSRKTKEATLSDDNPLLSQPPSNSTAAKMLKASNENAKIQNEISEQIRKDNGIIEERQINNVEIVDANNPNSFVSSLLRRFK